MKLIKIEVASCRDCPNHGYYDEYPSEDIPYCMQVPHKKEIDNINKIPDWCPLPGVNPQKE